MAATPSPAAVLAVAQREDDGRLAAQALLMLNPAADPWAEALPQITRLLTGQPGAALLAAFAAVPAAAVRRLVRLRAIATGVEFDGPNQPEWADLLPLTEAEATARAEQTAAALRRVNDVAAIADLLAQIVDAPAAQRRPLFDRLAADLVTDPEPREPAMVAPDDPPADDQRSIADLIAAIDASVPDAPVPAAPDSVPPYLMPIEDVFSVSGRGTAVLPPDWAPGPETAAMAAPEPAEVGAEPTETLAEPRRLQVHISDPTAATARTKAFRPGVTHAVAVRLSADPATGALIGPALNESAVRFETPADGGPASAALTVQFVSEAFGQTTTASQPLTLPQTGDSTTATFPLLVDAGATSVTCSILLFQGAALLQSALVTGPVSARDRAVDGAVVRIVADGEFVAVVGAAPALPTRSVQSSVSTHVGHPGEALVVADEGREAAVVSLPGATALRAQITEALRMALDADATATTAAGRRRAASAQVRLMRSLAKLGNLLYQDLPDTVRKLGAQDAVQLICGSDDIVPLEIVYDYGFPSSRAALCPDWKAALATGTCTCVPADGEVRTICPLGFWGLRLVIERQVSDRSADGTASAGLPSPGRTTLRPMNRVLFAASQKVDLAPGDPQASAIADTVAVLTERLGKANVANVKTWPTWRSTITRKRPGLILSLPHNDRDELDLPRLEIGRGKLLSVGALDRSYVTGTDADPDGIGPVVFLLGCNTANEALPWYTAAAAFRRRGAAVVVGTLSEALGRQTAPMTRLLAELLWGAPGVEPIQAETLGDIMLLIRRRLVAEGMTLGLSLVAFGHAGWLLPPAEPVRPTE